MALNRRKFLTQTAGIAMLGVKDLGGVPASKPIGDPARILNAYYFRAHTYTLVPSQVREDLAWMADLGTNAITLAILEQDLFAAVENIRIICDEAGRRGIRVFAVPSRWGGIVAGAPKVPSLFSVRHPETWVMAKDGKPVYNNISGVISSVYHPETLSFFKESLSRMLELWPVSGIVWDEPKCLFKDFSAAAMERNPKADWNHHLKVVSEFFGVLNAYLKSIRKDISTSLFLYAQESPQTIRAMAGIHDLDYFGCDGRPWPEAEGGEMEAKGKSLSDRGDLFISAARENGKNPLFLIENHNLRTEDMVLMEKGLPGILNQNLGQLIYYYYPRNVADPDRAMEIIRKAIRNSFRK